MIAAVITGGLALVTATILFFVLALDLRDAERQRADALVDAETKAGALAIAAANEATQRARADSEKRRADALDDLIAKHLHDGPIPGAFDRLMLAYRAARAGADPAGGSGAVPVPSEPAAGAAGPGQLRGPGLAG